MTNFKTTAGAQAQHSDASAPPAAENARWEASPPELNARSPELNARAPELDARAQDMLNGLSVEDTLALGDDELRVLLSTGC